MNFLELSPLDLEPQFGPRFLYQSYLNLMKSTKKPDKLVLIPKKDFDELRNQVQSLTKSLEQSRVEFTTTLADVQKEFTTLLEASKEVPGPVSPIVMTKVDVPSKSITYHASR